MVIAIGRTWSKHSPEHWNPARDKKIVCIDSLRGDREYFLPGWTLVGDLYHSSHA